MKYLFAFLYLIYSVNISAQSLETIGQLARDGAPNLALQLMDQVQPNAQENTPGWVFFERQRFAIMQSWQQWQNIIDRHNALPQGLPEAFTQWAQLQKVDAQLKLGLSAEARNTLVNLLWLSENKSQLNLPLIRRLIIRSYLIEEKFDDVDLAMRQYENSYVSNSLAWQKLRARVLLNKNQPANALRFLGFADGVASELVQQDNVDHEAVAMRLLAQLNSKQRTPKSILGDVRAFLTIDTLRPLDRLRYYAVGSEAARNFGGMLTRVRLLEQALESANDGRGEDELFDINGDDLWQAYSDYAAVEGNKEQLLIGQDQRWLDEAAKWVTERPEKAKALYSMVMHKGVDFNKQAEAYRQFTTILNEQDNGLLLMRHLFASESYYPNTTAIPLSVKYQLVDEAIARQDIQRASELILGIEQAPEEADRFNWALRRARVLILGGKIEQGRIALNNLLADKALAVLDSGENAASPDNPYAPLDAFLQVVFDLQKVNDHAGAIELMNKILQRLLPGALGTNLRREMLFWVADSHKADSNQGRNPVLAAAYYLRSATLLDGIGNDPWGQTARFQAADVLAKEGVVEDARRIYQDLLKITQDPARRAMIQYRLQELWLEQAS